MIKKISSLFLLATLVLVASCSSDSDGNSGTSETKVKYRVSVGSGVTISTVNYRNADGEFVAVTATNPSEWTKEISVEMPFDADFDALITNTSGSPKSYNTYIYVNGTLTVSGSGFIEDGESQIVGENYTVDE